MALYSKSELQLATIDFTQKQNTCIMIQTPLTPQIQFLFKKNLDKYINHIYFHTDTKQPILYIIYSITIHKFA